MENKVKRVATKRLATENKVKKVSTNRLATATKAVKVIWKKITMEERMKTVIFAYSKRVSGHSGYKHICVSTSVDALRRHENETTGIDFSYPDCQVMCDVETYRWIEARQVHGVLVLDAQYREEIKSMHFYKEIQML